ncbi:LLM class F420-dependent oxidoreductase [Acidiferrimicrobium sp. IK]|uniref:LLM class F420-dependent oxidoreductase n=1 Tax=Acidiferrimicrobium sp. IK TaxID=2871700 RepID=UPI0021CB1A30|nr:LLM class F420-dependent oxidoreductase [Acidiferrimicrobium sp. IK]MCU4184508.1 LLM class F420-dependent oxidoreductase [Acidiferrimicrobium sp. IK]
MYVDGGLSNNLGAVAEQAARVEADGYDAAWGSETNHDPFLPMVLAAGSTQRLLVGTGIAVAFARNPMITANVAWDLNAYSKGRFLLGLGSQIKPHIEKRFSMPWSHPAPRMREFISAMRAIWACWQEGTPLDFRGEFYRHTLMTPFFDPGPNDYGAPKVFLAAVGTEMTKVAAEVADGMLVHGFSTAKYLREVTLPTIEAGLSASGRTRADFQLSYPLFIVTGASAADIDKAAVATRKQIAFYASTPAYRRVLDVHGWGDLQERLNVLSKRGEWDAMGEQISDEVLEAFAVVAAPDDVAGQVIARVGDLVDRVSFYTPAGLNADAARQILTDLHAA